MNTISPRGWDGIAAALEYPGPDTAKAVRHAASELKECAADDMATALHTLAEYLDKARLGEPEERYTVLFDMKPVCSLYMGWHIFEDTYARGALLAGLAHELRAAQVVYEHDIPDFLPTLLRLLPRLQDQESRVMLTHALMLRGLEPVVDKIAHSDSVWTAVLTALPRLLDREIPAGETEIPRLHKRLEVLQC